MATEELSSADDNRAFAAKFALSHPVRSRHSSRGLSPEGSRSRRVCGLILFIVMTVY